MKWLRDTPVTFLIGQAMRLPAVWAFLAFAVGVGLGVLLLE